MADLIIAHPACSGMFFACDRTKKSFNEGLLVFQSGVPEGTRTPDRALRRRMLYPAELPGHCFLSCFERSIIISKSVEECKRFWHILLLLQGLPL